jgi:hypothetical protein
MAHLPRGIAPDLLVSQVRNTMPYLFEPQSEGTALEGFPPARVLREIVGHEAEPLTHFEYFRLCLSSHYLTCATPVPTDVDNQIRLRLWPEALPVETALEMAGLVLESRTWDFAGVTRRHGHGLSGHLGEWFTVACGAYCALKRYAESEAQALKQELFAAIRDEVHHHSEVFGSLWRARDGLGCLKASASLAHNFGDLDRVMDMWELDVGDPLRLEFYKLAAAPFDTNRKLRHLGRLWVAGELYKSTIPGHGSSMALENHRHYALRKARSLRRSPELMITTGPFFDGWGREVAARLEGEELREVFAMLVSGWARQPKTLGYGRALRAIQAAHPELVGERVTDDGFRRSILGLSPERFEKHWADEALQLMDDIPSRAT